MRKCTDITLILDRSGSMASCRDDTIGAVNTFVEQQRSGTDDCLVSLVQFDDKYEPVYQGLSPQLAPVLTKDTYVPRGATALLDAVGKTIDNIGLRLRNLPEFQRPEKILLVIVTDGYENSSREYSTQRVIDMVNHQRDRYSWEFVFLGADMDKMMTESVSRGLGIYQNSMGYGKVQTISTMSMVGEATKNYRSREEKTCANFFDLAKDTQSPPSLVVTVATTAPAVQPETAATL